MNKNQRFSKKKNDTRQFLKTKTSEIIDYFPRDNNDEDFGYNLASVDNKNFIISNKSELLKKKRKQESKAKSKLKDMDEDLENIDFKKGEDEKSSSRALLPNFKIGDLVLLSICEIRQTYMIANFTRNKKAMIHLNYSGFDPKEENFSFSKYFKIGQFVCGAVISPGNDIQLPQGYMNKKILVSIDPKIVNTGLKSNSLCEGMDLWGKLTQDKLNKLSADFSLTDSDEELYKFNSKFDNDYEDEEKSDKDIDESEEKEDDLGLEEKENSEEDDVSQDESEENLKEKKISNIQVKIVDLEEGEHYDPEILKNKIINSYYFFKIIKIENENNNLLVQVTMNQNKLKFGIKKLDFTQIRPGFLFKANQTRDLLNGIEVAFAGNLGSIFIDHLKQSTKKNKNLYVRVIHVAVARKNLSLSALTNITNLHNDLLGAKGSLVGNTFKSVKLSHEIFGGSYLVNLSDNQAGFIHKKNIILGETKNEKSKKTENAEVAEVTLTEGTELPMVMVKEYNYFDDRAVLTSINIPDENNKTDNFFTWENLKVGRMITGKIKEVHSDYILVSINDFISGKLTKDLLSDYSFSAIPKKFSVGNKIICRIFRFDYMTKNLEFVAKESLMDETIHLYDNLQALKEGEEIHVIYLGNGLFQHSGDIIGKLQNFSVLDKKEKYKLGKVYRFNVYKVNLTTRKLFLSKDKNVYVPSFGDFDNFLKKNSILLTVVEYLNEDFENEKLKPKKGKNQEILTIDSIHEGSLYDFEIISIKKILKLLIKKGFNSSIIDDNMELLTQKIIFVKIPNLSFYGFLQVELLSDFFKEQQFKIITNISNNLAKLLKEKENKKNSFEGFKISDSNNLVKKLLVVNFDKEKKIMFTSAKNSLFEYASEGLIPRTKEELFVSKDNIFCGFVNKVNEKGIIVQFLGKNKFLIRNRKTLIDSKTDELKSDIKSIEKYHLNDNLISSLEPGQTIFVSSTYDKMKDKLRFSTGIDVFKTKFSNNTSNIQKNYYTSEKIMQEAEFYIDYYTKDFKFCCTYTPSINELLEFNNSENKTIEGFVTRLTDDNILINLVNHKNLTGCMKIENSKQYKKEFSHYALAEFKNTIFKKYESSVLYKFMVLDIDYVKEIIYLTDDFDNLEFNKEKKHKNLIKTSQNFVVDLINQNFISCHLETDFNIKAMLPCNLFNLCYEKIFSESMHDEIVNPLNLTIHPGDKLNCLVKNYDSLLNKYILEFPTDIILETIKAMIKIITPYLSNFNSRKSSVSEKIVNLFPGRIINKTINGIKKNFVYVYIDKYSIGRISFKGYNGDHEAVKKLLSENSRKSSVNDINKEKTKEEKFNLSKQLKQKFKVLHIEEIGKFKICDLVNFDKNEQINILEKDSELSEISEKTQLDGETALSGIISKIDFTSKHPIRIDYSNSLEKKSKNKSYDDQDTSLYVHFSNLLDFNQETNITDKKINDLFSLGEEIKFYCKKNTEGIFITSLIPFSKLVKKIDVEKKYLIRILKSITGRGLIVSVLENNNESKKDNLENKNTLEAFVDLTEISDDLHANPLKLYPHGQIVLGRVLNFDSEKSKKYFISLRDSITNDTNFDILKNGSTIKFTKNFAHFEKTGDYRNKIFKFGASLVLENNQIVLGYVTSSTEKGVFIKIGKDTVVRAGLKELSDEKTTQPNLLFKQDELVICRITSIYKKDHQNENEKQFKVNVSLRESVIKYNLSLKMKDLNANNFYECYIMNETDDKFEVCIVGSTFVGLLKKKAKFLKKDGDSLKELKACLENKKNIILEIKKLDKNVHPPKIRFSNLSIDNQISFDRNLVINLLSEEDKIKNEINEELFKNVRMIIEKEQQDDLSDELKELEKDSKDVDFEALIVKRDQNLIAEEDNSDDENAVNSEDDEINIKDIDDSEDNENINLMVKNIFNFLIYFY